MKLSRPTVGLLLLLTTFMGLAFDKGFCLDVRERRVLTYFKWMLQVV